MSRTVLVLIVIILFVIAGFGLYFIFAQISVYQAGQVVQPNVSGQNPPKVNTTGGNSNPASAQSSFTIQGMKVEILTQGTGSEAVKSGDTVTVNYTSTTTDGKKVDSSYDRGTPLTLKVGENQVIKGWNLGLIGMKVGEKRRLTIPPELAYGKNGFPAVGIPGNATLIFEVELLGINQNNK